MAAQGTLPAHAPQAAGRRKTVHVAPDRGATPPHPLRTDKVAGLQPTGEEGWAETAAPPPRGTRMLPNLGALARGDVATSGPVLQGSPSSKEQCLSDFDGHAHQPSPLKALPDELLRLVLLAIDTDDVEAACRTADAYCGADKYLKRTACEDQNMWFALTERVFKSTQVDKALFAHDELLGTDPRAAFVNACLDRQVARAVGLVFLWRGLSAVKRRLYDEWKDEEMEDEDEDEDEEPEGQPIRHEVHQREDWTATDIVDTFHDTYPAVQKFKEWQLLAEEAYRTKKIQWFDSPKYESAFTGPRHRTHEYVIWALQGGAQAESLGFHPDDATHPTGFGPDWPMTPVHAEGWDVLKGMVQTPTNRNLNSDEPWKVYFERVYGLVRALAERVGMATVWMWHTSGTATTDEHALAERARNCVRAFPDTHLPPKE